MIKILKIVTPQQSLPQNAALVSWTHDPNSNTTFYDSVSTISSKIQFFSSKDMLNILWYYHRNLNDLIYEFTATLFLPNMCF